MTSKLRHITIDCSDSYLLAEFWSQVTGRPMHPDDQPGDPEAILEAPEGEGAHILFVVVPEGKPDEPRTDFAFQSSGLA